MKTSDNEKLHDAIKQLEVWLAAVEEVKGMEEEDLRNAESAESPDEELTDKLYESTELLESGIETIRSGIDELRALLSSQED